MGHIELVAPVSHIWYFKGIPSRMGLILDISPRDLEKVLYFSRYIVTDPGDTELEKNQILSEKEYLDMREKYEDDFKAGMGAEAIKDLLCQIDVEKLSNELRAELEDASGQKKTRILKRLEVAEAFRQSGNRPEWMILDVIPVIPPISVLWFSLTAADSQPPTSTTFTGVLSTETTVLKSSSSSVLPTLSSEMKRECFRRLLTHL